MPETAVPETASTSWARCSLCGAASWVGGLSHDDRELVERDVISVGARMLALMAIDMLGLAQGA